MDREKRRTDLEMACISVFGIKHGQHTIHPLALPKEDMIK